MMTSGTVLGVGAGVFITAVIWILSTVFGMILLRASGTTRLVVVPVFLLALIITLALVFFPRSSETPSLYRETQIVDTLYIGRYVLLSVVSAVFLVALFMLLPQHLLDQVHAKPLRTH